MKTQTNEALNNSQASVTPKSKVFHTSPSFSYRHAITVGTHNMGYRRYWTDTFDRVGVRYSTMFENHLERADRKKEQVRARQRKKETKRKRAHKQAAIERQVLYEERTSQDYASGIGLDIGHKKPANKTSKSGKDDQEPKACKWCKLTTHQTKRSKKCPFNAKNIAAQQEQAHEEQKSSNGSNGREPLLCRPCSNPVAEEKSEEKNEAESASNSTTEVVRDVVNI